MKWLNRTIGDDLAGHNDVDNELSVNVIVNNELNVVDDELTLCSENNYKISVNIINDELTINDKLTVNIDIDNKFSVNILMLKLIC